MHLQNEAIASHWPDISLMCPLLPESICSHGFPNWYSFSEDCFLPSFCLYLDFTLTKVICNSGNGSIMSSDLLAKCLPCILCAIQSSLGLASAYWRVKFHMFMELRGILEKKKKTHTQSASKRNAKSLQMSRHKKEYWQCLLENIQKKFHVFGLWHEHMAKDDNGLP